MAEQEIYFGVILHYLVWSGGSILVKETAVKSALCNYFRVIDAIRGGIHLWFVHFICKSMFN